MAGLWAMYKKDALGISCSWPNIFCIKNHLSFDNLYVEVYNRSCKGQPGEFCNCCGKPFVDKAELSDYNKRAG